MDSIKGTLFSNQLVSKPIQPAVLVKDSVPSKIVGMKDLQTSTSGKFCNTHVNSEKRDTEVFEMLSLHTANFFFLQI